MNANNVTDPLTTFTIDDSYTIFTDAREFKGKFLSRYITETGDYVIQLQTEDAGVEEVYASKVTGWRKED